MSIDVRLGSQLPIALRLKDRQSNAASPERQEELEERSMRAGDGAVEISGRLEHAYDNQLNRRLRCNNVVDWTETLQAERRINKPLLVLWKYESDRLQVVSMR